MNTLLIEKIKFWFLTNCVILASVLVYHCVALRLDWFTPFKTIERADLDAKLTDFAYAMAEVQEVQIEQHEKLKKVK